MHGLCSLGSSHVAVGTARNGVGLFATKPFRADETIIKLAGRIVHYGILWERRGTFAANCIRFGPETYLDPGDQAGRYLNHSCEPNAGIRKNNNQLFLFAAKRIEMRHEIVIDYSTTIGDDDVWTMRCDCGRRGCRGKIKRFGTLPVALKTRYLSAGLVPKYIVATLE